MYGSDNGAELAVDGQYTGQCEMPSGGLTKAAWGVDLGGVKNIHHVLIHYGGMSIFGIIYFKITYYYLNESMLY